MLSDTFFYVHIPKTGGTSFRKAFEQYISSGNTYYDYGPISDITHPVIKENKYQLKDIFSLVDSEIAHKEKSLICGHVEIGALANIVLPENIFTFLRDPVGRVVSHYKHMKRKQGYSKSLEQFCQEDRFRNIQHKMLLGYPLHAIGFIGITEDYTNSLQQLEVSKGINLKALHLNKSVRSKEVKRYDIPQETCCLIKEMNTKDILLYNRAVKLNEQRNQPSHDWSTYSCVEDSLGSLVSGWCFQRGCNTPLAIEIVIDNEVIATTQTTVYRPIFKQINAPRGGYVGFRHNLDKKISNDKNVKCRIKGTNYYLYE